MSYGRSESLSIAKELNVATLLSEVITRQDSQLDSAIRSGEIIAKFVRKGKSVLQNEKDISESIAQTSGNTFTNRIYLKHINRLVRQEGRRFPSERLTKKMRLKVMQAFNYAVHGHFSIWERIIQSEIISVIGSTRILKNTAIIPESLMDRVNRFMKGEHKEEDDFEDF